MNAASFVGRRRVARSSSLLRAALVLCLLFFFGLSWHGADEARPWKRTADLSRDSQRGYPSRRDASAPASPAQQNFQQHDAHDDRDAAKLEADGNTSPSLATMADDTAHDRVWLPLRLVTFNIRYSPPAHKPLLPFEQPWAVRSPKLAAQLRFITEGRDNAFICLQEVLVRQLADVQHELGPLWAHVGRGRGRGQDDGEFSPIFYRSDVWACERSETRWLSETPERYSRGWDASLERIVTIGLFTHRRTGVRVVVMSTHLDHLGVEARNRSAELLVHFAQEWAQYGTDSHADSSVDVPVAVLIAGDFNGTPDETAYRIMVAPESSMSDLADLIPRDRRYGNELTYTGFGPVDNNEPKRIDFLFIREPRAARVKSFGVLGNTFDDSIQASDHRAVVADMDLPI